MMRQLLLATVLLLSAAASARAEFETGLQSFEQGDFAAAKRELEPLAEQGDPRAQYVVGVMHLNGWGTAPDSAKAAEWFRRAAEKEHVQAQTELARMYRTGDGVPQDYGEMANWYLRAAEAGDVGSQLFIADSYAYGYGVEVDYVKAYTWYDIAIHYWGPLAVRARDVIAEKMTPEQIAEATAAAQDWLKKRAGVGTEPPAAGVSP